MTSDIVIRIGKSAGCTFRLPKPEWAMFENKCATQGRDPRGVLREFVARYRPGLVESELVFFRIDEVQWKDFGVFSGGTRSDALRLLIREFNSDRLELLKE